MTKLKYYRTKLNLNIGYIARACGVHFVDVVDWEYEGKAPEASLKILAKIYGVRKEELEGEVLAIANEKRR